MFGLGLAGYPWISNYLFENRVQSEVKSFQNAVSSMDEQEQAKVLAKAEEYNRNLSNSQVVLTDPFVEDKQNKENVLFYSKLLRMNDAGMMGYVEIPAIDVSLPIFHGTSASVLEIGTGHLKGSSLPVGGVGTHTVITGHTGLNKAKLFTDLTELEEGDVFFFHIAGRDLAYEVSEINVVVPEDTSKLRIVPEQDLATLVTCTPYGVNSHRLFVTGKRVPYTEKVRKEAMNHGSKTESMWMKTYKKAILIGIVVAIGLLSMIGFVQRMVGRKRE